MAMISERVSGFYDTYPFPGKLDAYGPWRELAPKLLAIAGLAPRVLEGARVLDAGCGTGEYARSFAQFGARVTAIDLSAGALATARQIDQSLELRGVEYRQGSLLALTRDETFDYILCLGVLHHTAKPALGFQHLVQHLRPGGHLFIGLYSSVSRAHIIALRYLLRLLGGGDRERAIDIAQQRLGPILPLFIGRDNVDQRARVADLLAHPHERPVSLHRSLRWYARAGIDVKGCSPSGSLADYPMLARLVPGENSRLAYFAIQARWLLWNADYYVVAGLAPDDWTSPFHS
jgi:SAM-dependent methyltransferase